MIFILLTLCVNLFSFEKQSVLKHETIDSKKTQDDSQNPSTCEPKGENYILASENFDAGSNLYECNNPERNRLNAEKCTLKIYSCIFTSIISSEVNGGAIYLSMEANNPNNKYNNTINYCEFNGCSAKNGGAIYIDTSQAIRNFNIFKCHFRNNKATEEMGGALYLKATFIDLLECEFINNIGNKGADVYYWCSSTSFQKEYLFSLKSNKFIQNNEKVSKSNCMIYINWKKKSWFNFVENEIQCDDDTYLFEYEDDGKNSVTESKFIYKSNSDYSYVVKEESKLAEIINKKDPEQDPSESETSSFEGEWCPTQESNENLIELDDDKEYSADPHKIIYGCDKSPKRINSSYCLLRVYHCKIDNIKDTEHEGGAIFINAYKPDNDNYSTPEGDYEMIDCQFNQCESIKGGAVYCRATQYTRLFKIISCKFNQNKAAEDAGGAIFFYATYGIIEHCEFLNNNANEGSDIYYHHYGAGKFESQSLLIQNNVFKQKSDLDSTVFYSNQEASSLVFLKWRVISNFVFKKNEISIECSSNTNLFAVDEKDITGEIKDSNFILEENCISPTVDYVTKSSQLSKLLNDNCFSGTCEKVQCPDNIQESSTSDESEFDTQISDNSDNSESESESNSQSESESNSDSQIESESNSDSQYESESNSDSQSESESNSDSQTESESNSDSQTESESNSDSQIESESNSDSQSENQLHPIPEPNSESQNKNSQDDSQEIDSSSIETEPIENVSPKTSLTDKGGINLGSSPNNKKRKKTIFIVVGIILAIIIICLIILLIIYKKRKDNESKDKSSLEIDYDANSNDRTIEPTEFMNVLYNSDHDKHSDVFDCSESANEIPVKGLTKDKPDEFDTNDISEIWV